MMKRAFRLGLAAMLVVTMIGGQAAAVGGESAAVGVSTTEASLAPADGGVITSAPLSDGDCHIRSEDTDGDGKEEIVIDCE